MPFSWKMSLHGARINTRRSRPEGVFLSISFKKKKNPSSFSESLSFHQSKSDILNLGQTSFHQLKIISKGMVPINRLENSTLWFSYQRPHWRNPPSVGGTVPKANKGSGTKVKETSRSCFERNQEITKLSPWWAFIIFSPLMSEIPIF